MKALKFPKYYFNSDGLRFPVLYLSMMKQHIRNLTIHEQSEFVDMVTYELTQQSKIVIPTRALNEFSLQKINTTYIGNTAFIALYHPNELQRDLAKSVLQKLKTYEKIF